MPGSPVFHPYWRSKNEGAQKMGQTYLNEFTAFFNNPDTLTGKQATVHKSNVWRQVIAQATRDAELDRRKVA